jgi:hypothetical protein
MNTGLNVLSFVKVLDHCLCPSRCYLRLCFALPCLGTHSRVPVQRSNVQTRVVQTRAWFGKSRSSSLAPSPPPPPMNHKSVMQQLAIDAGVVGLLAAIDMRISSQLQPINTKLDDLTTIVKHYHTENN